MTNLYSVSYNTNNSTGGTTPPTQTAESKNDTYTFVAPTAEQYGLAKTDYVLVGWAENPNATIAQYGPGSTIILTNTSTNKVLYAIWMSWDTTTTMQEMSTTICKSTSEGSSKQLIDIRDNKSYWVAKLKDGNCWMTQNLDLDLQQGVALTPATSDVNSNWTPGPNESTITTTLIPLVGLTLTISFVLGIQP